MKSYTDLEQSRMLAKILPLETADMKYKEYTSALDYSSKHLDIPSVGHPFSKDIPCWSLVALFKLLPKSARLEKGNVTELYRVTLPVELETSDWYIEPIDACVEMIIHLHELNLL